MVKYRMLRKGERVREGDGFKYFGIWRKVESYDKSIGMKFDIKIHWPVRRKVKTPGGAEGR